jgi:TonB family protein
MRVYRGMLLSVVCTGIALAGSQLARSQDATSATLPERSEPVQSAPTPIPEKRTSKASVEISAKTPSQKPAPVAEDTSRAEELTTPAATAEKKTRAKRRATSAAQPTASEFPVVGTMSMSAAKDMAISTPLPEYPYQARRANITGSGVCVMIVDTASGNVTSALMAESTGNAILDKVTTDTFRKWRFNPGAVSQIRVPISYE